MRKLRIVLSGRLLPCALLLFLLFAAGVFLAVRLPVALAPIAALERLFSLGVALSVMNAPLPSESKTARLFLLLLLPWLGAFFCLLLRPKKAALQPPAPPPFEDGVTSAVAAISSSCCGLDGCFADSAEYFSTGRAFCERLLLDLQGAKREILLDYYILAKGKFFGSVLAICEQKAKAGVEVRLIYDDFGCAATLPRDFAKKLRAKGISAGVFHPMKPFRLGALNRRDHRKLAVIDGEIAYTGGANLADEYVGELVRFGHWKDVAVRVTGAPAAKFASLFGKPAPEALKSGNIPCVAFADGTENGVRAGEEIYLRLISSACESLELCTPYLAPSERVLTALKSAACAGVKVRVAIPHVPDKKSVFLVTRSYARELEKSGVLVREYAAGFLHAKTLLADEKYAVVGSYNLDERSLRIQAECGVFLESEKFAREIKEDFSAVWETGVPVPKARAFERFIACILRLFKPMI